MAGINGFRIKLLSEAEGASGCLPERDSREVSSSRACLEGPPLHQMGGVDSN